MAGVPRPGRRGPARRRAAHHRAGRGRGRAGGLRPADRLGAASPLGSSSSTPRRALEPAAAAARRRPTAARTARGRRRSSARAASRTRDPAARPRGGRLRARGGGQRERAVRRERGASGSGSARAADPSTCSTTRDVGSSSIATRHAQSRAQLADRGAARRQGRVRREAAVPDRGRARPSSSGRAGESGRPLFVGFNRRHAPLAAALREHVAAGGRPLELLFRVNAGALPADHWLNDLGRGRRPPARRGLPLRRLRVLVRRRAARARLVHGAARAPASRSPPRSASRSRWTSPTARWRRSLYTTAAHPGLARSTSRRTRAVARPSSTTSGHSSYATGPSAAARGARTQDKGHARQFMALRQALAAHATPPPLDPLLSMAATLAALDAASEGRGRRIARSHGEPAVAGSQLLDTPVDL